MKIKMTAAKNEMGYLEMKKKLRGVLFKMLIGAVIGVIVGCGMSDHATVASCVFSGLLFSCVPAAWCLIPFVPLGVIPFLIKALLSIFLGLIITPISLAYYLIRMHGYKKKLQQESATDATFEQVGSAQAFVQE